MNATKPTQLWQLNENNNFQDYESEKRFDRWIDFLSANKAWPASNPEEAKECLSLLSRTNIVSKKVLKLRKELFETYSYLIVAKTTKIESVSSKFKKESTFFNSLLNGRWRSCSEQTDTQKISLFLPMGFSFEENGKELEKFEQYLLTGKVEITGDDVQFLYLMADYYQIPSLLRSCTKFIFHSLNSESFLPVLNFALERNFPNLAWACLAALFKDEQMRNYIFGQNVESQEVPINISNLLNAVQNLFKNGCYLVFADMCYVLNKNYFIDCGCDCDFYRTLHIHCEINENISADICKINDLIKINGLDIKNNAIESFESILSNINYLRIANTGIMNIPSAWQKSLEGIWCLDCPALTSIDAPHAKEIECKNCPALTSIDAPNATRKVDCQKCPALTSVNAPHAKEIHCAKCPQLTSINAPNAEKVDYRECSALININTPNAKEINCENCPALTDLNAPNAKEISCAESNSLTTINAPNAETIFCRNCPVITLDLPCAKKINCHACPALTSINAPRAEGIYFYACPMLISI